MASTTVTVINSLSPAMEEYNVPTYVETPQDPFDALLTRVVSKCSNDRACVEEFVTKVTKLPTYDTPQGQEPTESKHEQGAFELVRRAVVQVFYEAIEKEDNQCIALLFQHHLVSANIDPAYTQGTPLLQAISQNPINIGIIKQLLALGADPNAFGYPDPEKTHCLEKRTPLMLAAARGSLPVVKLLFEEPYSVDDALVAPDGEIAIHLALVAGHRAIVDYLPARRGGGFLRYKGQIKKNLHLMKKSLLQVFGVGELFLWIIPKFLVWTTPKFILWTVPRHCIKWCWYNRQMLLFCCKYYIKQLPKRVVRAGKAIWRGVKEVPKITVRAGKALWRGIKKIPKAVVDTSKAVWKFSTQTLPRWLRKLAIWVWKVLTVHLPATIREMSQWVWSGITSLSQAVWDIIAKAFSLLHTILQAMLTFLCNVTLRDILNGLTDLLRALFINLPQTIWTWVDNFGPSSFQYMTHHFGSLGVVVWNIFYLVEEMVMFIPKGLFGIIVRVFDSFGVTLHEIRVYINPKS